MKRAAALSFALFVSGWLCLVHDSRAQFCPQAGFCGKGATSTATVCGGTPVSLTSPNDLTNAAWTQTNVVVVANAVVAPDSTMTASSLTSSGTGSFAQQIHQEATSFQTGGVAYSATSYFKSLASPVWVLVAMQELGGSFPNWGAFFDVANGTVGNLSAPTNATTSCAIITSDTRVAGWFKLSIGGSFAVTPSNNVSFIVYLVDGNGTGAGTIGQSVAVWQAGA